MHLPDGFLDAKTALAAGAFSVCGLGLALHQVKKSLTPRRVPLLGLASAFVFAAQMVNFPIAGGTSGHLVGGALATALFGAPAAIVVMSTVLLAQCFLFADGGVTALGANLFNMAILAPTLSLLVLEGMRRLAPGPKGRLAGLGLAAWVSTVGASIACAGQFAWSGTVPWSLAFPALAGVHALIGLGEALISILVYATVAKLRPELLAGGKEAGSRGLVLQGLLAACGIALFVSPFACPWPDGLEAVASKLGFDRHAVEGASAPLADYQVGGIGSETLATGLAGLIGTAVVFLLAYAVGRALLGLRSRRVFEKQV
jgi:cobalt/nickel transport system permease protein